MATFTARRMLAEQKATALHLRLLGTLTVLHSFTDGNDGSEPYGGLTLGRDGNFYGTAYSGGAYRAGVVFKITPSGRLTVLHNFSGSDGALGFAPPIQGTDGNSYGTTSAGGKPVCGYGAQDCGTVYKMTPSGALTTLYQFDFTHGGLPYAPLVQATDGKFYGVTRWGGNSSCQFGCGVVFSITSTGTFTVLHSFDNNPGVDPVGPLVQGTDGSFYGTTFEGGTHDRGFVFKITSTGTLTVLHDFNSGTGARGINPWAGLVQATDGTFYGTTAFGGLAQYGTIYRVIPKPFEFSVVHKFDAHRW
jgi:uncharacterized repeat protein (TIGR03803 family)